MRLFKGQSPAPMMESALPEDAPFSIEPIVAWRCWQVDVSKPQRGPLLRSITYRTIWTPGHTFRAHCLVQFRSALRGGYPQVLPHECPNPKHRCGIYAVNREEFIHSWAVNPAHVAGKVKLWGRVYIYEMGYIAEYAYPLSLTFRLSREKVDDYVWHALAENYQVEIDEE